MNGYLSNSDYDFIYSRSPRVCVDLVIKIGPVIHLIKREIQPYKNKWHLPGGRIRFRESIKNAIQRIALTEINTKVKIKNILGFMEFTREIQNRNKRHSISIVFFVEPLKKIHSEKIHAKKIHPVHYKFLKSIKFL